MTYVLPGAGEYAIEGSSLDLAMMTIRQAVGQLPLLQPKTDDEVCVHVLCDVSSFIHCVLQILINHVLQTLQRFTVS